MKGTPNFKLLKEYSTGDLWLNKQAGKLPLAAAVALPILGYMALRSGQKNREQQQAMAQSEIDSNRALDLARNSGDTQALRNNPQLGSYQYLLYNQMAEDNQPNFDPLSGKIAARIGAGLAKSAGIGGMAMDALKSGVSKLPGIGRGSWKSQALMGGLALGGGYAAIKGTNAALGAIGGPAKVKVQGAGPALPRFTNQWGQPSL